MSEKMVLAEYIQRGEALDYRNETDTLIPAGTVLVIGSRVGVAGGDILPGEIGSVHMTGVYKIVKSGTSAIAMGAPLYFDGSGMTDTAASAAAASEAGENGESGTTPASPAAVSVEAGYAAAPAAAADGTVLVKLCG